MTEKKKQEKEFSMKYWEYYCALESDFKQMSRFIDYSDDNLKTYSIELTRILLSASSELDVIFKDICFLINPSSKPEKIDQYRIIIRENLNQIIDEKVSVGFHFFNVQPFKAWENNITPKWWKMHNKVKHQRNTYFKEANLENARDVICALFICVNYYYMKKLEPLMKKQGRENFSFKDVTAILKSDTQFIKFTADYYVQTLRVN
ncbi:hypothetical protein BA195_13640 [Tenacibaculum soleae]|uniref:Uncharacterized protein n=1 Tax=Tenacibaculum soleae TaxID=447689 RepID=A0A1B9XWC8_9FLAO|nr:hypothetical protein [Tenacibaculum soleae]OCK41829.1 hypothetical protein BA195_13640 [Tenacibaculum soleae]